MRKVGIIGVGHSKFGVRNDVNMNELVLESFKPALDEANIDLKDISFLVVSNVGLWSSEELPAITIAEYLGLTGKGAMRIEAACASGSAALKVAHDMISSGEAEIVAAIGVEKMNESFTPNVVEIIGRAGNYFWEFENFGMTFPGYYAMYATAYMSVYGATEEDLGEVAIKNHFYGAKNPLAHFQKEITMEDYLKSKYVAWPIKLLDSTPISDGAVTVILASEDAIRKIGSKDVIWIKSIGYSTDTSNLSKRSDFLSLEAARRAAEIAYKKASIDPSKITNLIDVAEVHDCFTIAEILAYEDLGFFKRGEGFLALREKQTYRGGKIPVNLSGGLKAKGHPIGATGLSMIAELTKQLKRQVEKSRQADIKNGWALAHNVGGTGHYAYVTILSTEK
ncbi:MAG: thiolase domain-containing protein [Thermoproteota archaeon]|nr:thiolase domain-containing protein [Thermoproteota archaeon]